MRALSDLELDLRRGRGCRLVVVGWGGSKIGSTLGGLTLDREASAGPYFSFLSFFFFSFLSFFSFCLAVFVLAAGGLPGFRLSPGLFGCGARFLACSGPCLAFLAWARLPPRDPLPRLRLFRRFKICDRLNSSVCSVCSVSESTFWRSLPASLSDESWSSSWSSSSELDSDSELELELRLELLLRLRLWLRAGLSLACRFCSCFHL